MTELFDNLYGTVNRVLKPARKFLTNLLDAPVVVLIYHRVSALESDPQVLAVSPDNFRAQMRHLKENYPVLRFEEDWSKAQRPAIVITFDDGYADNALQALPILEEVGLPATFFVSTGTIGTTEAYWWDEVGQVLLGKRQLPPALTLADGGRQMSWPTGSAADRTACYHELMQLMVDGNTERRSAWLQSLRDWSGTHPIDAGADRALTVDELRRMAASDLVTIGAHTVTHSSLAALSRSAQHEEIETSKRHLESWLEREITVFSYPYGRLCDFTEETVSLCRAAGFQKSAANVPGQAHRWTDPFKIPRQLVRDWPVEVFEERLRGFWRS